MAVKSAFERNYRCMGITCRDVGGFYDGAIAEYHAKAAPCGGFIRKSINMDVNVGIPKDIRAVAGVMARVVAALALVVWFFRHRNSDRSRYMKQLQSLVRKRRN